MVDAKETYNSQDYKPMDENAMVYKANCLSFFKEDVFTLPVLKLLDIAISRINAKNPDDNEFYVSKAEFEKATGISRLKPEAANKYAKALMQPITIKDPKGQDFINISLFWKSMPVKDGSGRWYFRFVPTPDAWDYFFGIDKIGYMSYRLSNTAKLNSKYSFLLFNYLSKNTFRRSWYVEIGKLLKEIHCDTELYADFRNFRRKVLDLAISEINDKTDISVSYEKVVGEKNKTLGIQFTASARIGEDQVVRQKRQEFLDNNKERIKHIQKLSGLDENAAISIVERMYANGISDEEAEKRIRYAKDRPDVDNLLPYIISLLDNHRWSEPKKSANSFGAYQQRSLSEINEWEQIFQKALNG